MIPFDQTGNLVSSNSASDTLRRSTVRGVGATLFAGMATLALQVGATMVLARILTPTDFGLVAMVTTFSLLLANFGFNGFTEAIVQREEMSHSLASNLFWINIGCGIVLTLAFAAAGSLLALFYHNPLVKQVTVGISLTIFATSISTVHLALLKRLMRFTSISANDICARLALVIVSIVLALRGFGYWALVVGAIAQPISTAIGAIIMCRWIPGRPRRVKGTGETVQFALHTYGNFTLNYFSRNTDNLLVGWRFSASQLGFYKKAYDLFAVAATQLTSTISVVVVAGLSRLRKSPALYRRYLVDILGLTAFVGMYLGSVLTLISKDLILVMMGPKWLPAGQIFTFFGPGVGIMILYATHGWIHLSVGRADRWFRWGIFEYAVTCLLFIVGLHWGPVGIATAWSTSFWLLTIPAIWYAGKPIELSIVRVVSACWRYFVASFITVSATMLVMSRIPQLTEMTGLYAAVLRIVLMSAGACLIYVGTVVLLSGGFTPITRFVDFVKEMLEARKRIPEDQVSQSVIGSSPEPPEQAKPDNIPLVSILIPAYNAQEWIAGTIRSAIEQTWPRTEIIVVDDGSKDRTVEVARQFGAQGVHVVTQKNQGASAARNKAFSLCHGDYIQWLDADDLLAPDKISRQMEVVAQGLSSRTLLSSAWGRFMYRPSRIRLIPTSLWSDLTPQQWLLHKMDENVFMQTATWLVSRELTEAAGPWDTRLLGDDDGEYFCRVLLASDGVRFVRDATVYYRCFHFNSLSYIGRFPEKVDAHWTSMKLHIQYLRSLGDTPRARAACIQFLRDSMIYFYPDQPHILKQANQLAEELGEALGVPYVSWKYAWIVRLFGWDVTKEVQHQIRKVRWQLAKKFDYWMFELEGRKSTKSATQSPRPSHADEVEQLVMEESRLTRVG